MFDIGFLELLIIAVIALVVLGPERLPHAIKVTAIWVARIKRSFSNIRTEIEKEINADDIRREIHNAAVMDELKKAKSEVEQRVSDLKQTLDSPLESLTTANAVDKAAAAEADEEANAEQVSVDTSLTETNAPDSSDHSVASGAEAAHPDKRRDEL